LDGTCVGKIIDGQVHSGGEHRVTTILLVAIVVFGLPAWIPFLRGKYSADLSKRAFVLVFLGQVLQLFFVAAVGANLIPLYYSARFALVGLLLGIAGAILGCLGLMRHGSGSGCVVTAALSVLGWLFLVSMH
jgi:hypothetical protein